MPKHLIPAVLFYSNFLISAGQPSDNQKDEFTRCNERIGLCYYKLGKGGEKATVLSNLSDIYHAMGNEKMAIRMLDSSTFIARKLNLTNHLQQKKKDNRIIAGAREKSDQLLLNILPAGIANDLKEKGKTEPKVFGDVTACFIDELNQTFTAFDNIIETHGCERIKTIGESYLAVSGLPNYNPRHAEHITKCCVEMIRYIRECNEKSQYNWEVRVGVHSGEVIAGVVGVKKYINDVFGDTINTASRMQTNSEPMKINVSETTYNLIKNEFSTEYRGELDVRGKGNLKMYFVTA
jgi:hypothetical protein